MLKDDQARTELKKDRDTTVKAIKKNIATVATEAAKKAVKDAHYAKTSAKKSAEIAHKAAKNAQKAADEVAEAADRAQNTTKK